VSDGQPQGQGQEQGHGQGPGPGRTRDAARSREAILDAAERLFAAQGYDAASLEEIGRLAGVSRGTPRYFFGAKEDLYRAVLARVLTAEAELLLAVQARAGAAGDGPEATVAALVEGFVDFLVARPAFVRLVEREAAAGGRILQEVAAETEAVQSGMASLGAYFAGGPFREEAPSQILLALLALSWFPLAHAETFTRAFGFDADDPEFLAAWKRFVVGLVLRGARAG
jgi:TetR/AcrR family transcriptional regulator